MKSLSRVAIDEELYRADFEITDRYQAFSTELLRLSLAGIAIFGFIYDRILIKLPSNQYIIPGILSLKSVFGLSILFFAISTISALTHRYLSSDSMAYQIVYLRLAERIDELNREQTSAERLGMEQLRLMEEKKGWYWRLKLCGIMLMISAISLGTAALVLTIPLSIIVFS